MKTIAVIPARYASTRFPGKPLVQLVGREGERKPLVQWTWEAAAKVRGIDEIFVATDDERIADCVNAFGGSVIMTSQSCRNGTERCAEAMRKVTGADVVLNFQGDAPLTPSWFAEAVLGGLAANQHADLATPVLRCDVEMHRSLIEDSKAGLSGATTAVFSSNWRALYFSKQVIPFARVSADQSQSPVFHHVGLYAYRADALERYVSYPEGELERLEGLEQLRFLENDRHVMCVEVDARGQMVWELNNPVDVERLNGRLG